jgi:hypothetical protein
MYSLIFWAGMVSNHTIHSQYNTEAECLSKQQYYSEVFRKVHSKVRPLCVSSTRAGKKPSTVVYYKETVY